MFYVVTLLCLLVAPKLIISITVSPDVGLRNITTSKNPIENKTINDLKLNNLTDRNRRLIPYMTFYIPQNEYPINQDYIPNPQQQEQEQQQPQHQQPDEHKTNPSGHHQSQSSQNEQNQMIAIYQSLPSSPSPPLNRLQHHSQLQQHHHQHNYPDSIENHLHSSSSLSAGQQQQQQQPTGTTFIPLHFHQNNHRGQIYQQILYQDHGRNQLPLLKLKGNIPVNQQQHHQQQYPQRVHHSQQQHGIDGRLLLKDNSLSKTKQQQQPPSIVHLYHPEQQQELTKTNLNSSPFTLFNKIPGHFTPIIYTNQGNNINYHENSQLDVGNTENDDIEQAHKQEEHIYKIQQQNQQHQLSKQQQQYYQYHHHHNHQNPKQQKYQQQQPEGNQNEQDVSKEQHQSQQLQQHQNHVGIVSSTQRPHFQIITESPQSQKHHYAQDNIYHQKPEIELVQSLPAEETSQILTPQQKYVAYLQRQLRNKQHTQQQQQQQTDNNYHQVDGEAYIINSSPLPSIAPQENHINYQENHPSSQQQQQHRHHHHQYIYRQQPQQTKIDNNNHEKEILYIQEDEKVNQQHTQNHNFVEYINIPEEHNQPPPTQQIPSTISPLTTSAHIIPQKDNNNIYKPIIYVTTAAPIPVTSVSSNYKQQQQIQHHHQQIQRLHPIVNPSNLSEKPILNNTITTQIHDDTIHRYNPQINQHKAPIFIVKPKLYLSKSNNQHQQQQIQPIRQHLTETTQLPSPNAYRPTSPLSNIRNNNNRHYYNRYYHKSSSTPLPSTTSSEIPLKLKPSQKFKQIIVTTLRPTSNLLNYNNNDDDNTESSSSIPPLIPKYEKDYHQSIDINRQPLKTIEEQQRPVKYHSSETINTFPDIKSSSLAEILRKLQDSNHLPQTITPNNIDNSIKTLIKILNNLKESQTINENPPQHHDEDYRDYDDTPVDNPDPSHRGPNSGRPGIDYPALYEIPHTSFNCKEQRYKGFFGDPETNCQVWHYCDLNGGQASFLCPNGTIFSQVALTCDWWFNVKCSSTAQLYVLNERLYKYILPFTPKFPEDYSGPLVDKYLALKFKEMEEKMTREKLKGREKSDENNDENKTKESDDESKEENDNKSDNDDDDENRSKGIDERSNPTGEDQEIKSINLEDVEDNLGSVDTGITYNTISTSSEHSLTLKPIVVSSTTIDPPVLYHQSQPTPFTIQSSTVRPHQYESNQDSYKKSRISIESEQVELIEIKTDGSSGHLVPSNSQYTN